MVCALKPSPNPKLIRAARLIERARSCTIVAHVRPDGDALGSMLALGLALRSAGMQVVCACEDSVPRIYRFLPGADMVRQDLPAELPDLAIAVDCDGISRTGRLPPRPAGVPPPLD